MTATWGIETRSHLCGKLLMQKDVKHQSFVEAVEVSGRIHVVRPAVQHRPQLVELARKLVILRSCVVRRESYLKHCALTPVQTVVSMFL